MQYKILSSTPSFTLEVYPKPASKPETHPEIKPTTGKAIKNIFTITSEDRLKAALDAVLVELGMSSTPGVTEANQLVLDQDQRWQAVVWQLHEKGLADKFLTILMRPVIVEVVPEPSSSTGVIPGPLAAPKVVSDEDVTDFASVEMPGDGLRKTAVVASQLINGVASVMALGDGSLLVQKNDGHLEILGIASSQFSLTKVALSEVSLMTALFPSVDGKTALGIINTGDATDIIRYELDQTPAKQSKVATVKGRVDSLIELETAFVVLSAGKLIRLDKVKPDAIQTLAYADANIVDITRDTVKNTLYFSTDQGHLYSLNLEGDQFAPLLIRKSDKGSIKMLRAIDDHVFFSTEHDVFTSSDTWVYRHQSGLNDFQVFRLPTLDGVIVVSGGNDVVMTHLVGHQRDVLWKSPKPSDPKLQIPVSSIYAHGEGDALLFVVIRENKQTGAVQVELLQPGVSEQAWSPQFGQQVSDAVKHLTRHGAVRAAGEVASGLSDVTVAAAGFLVTGALDAVNYVFGGKTTES
jgi:hypothetical protein